MSFKRIFIVFSLLVLVSAGIAHAQSEQTLLLTYVPNIQFSPVYVAIEKGYFAAQGINVVLQHGDENVNVDLIASNQAQFGLVSGEEVLKARANGRPVVSVYEWFQAYPIGIVYPEGMGIDSVATLKGHKVGIPGRFGASYNGLTALLNANGLTEADIQLEPIGFTAPDSFCAGVVEATVVYTNNEPIQIASRIQSGQCNNYTAIKVLAVSDAVDMVSNGIITNEETLKNNPQLVAAIVTAFNDGLRDVIANPLEAYLLSAKYVENLPLTADMQAAFEAAMPVQQEAYQKAGTRTEIRDARNNINAQLTERFGLSDMVQYHVLLQSIELWDADILGFADVASWQNTAQVLTNMGAITTTVDVTAAFSNQFIVAG